MVNQLGDAVRFMETITGISVGNLSRVEFYTSHERCCSNTRRR